MKAKNPKIIVFNAFKLFYSEKQGIFIVPNFRDSAKNKF